MNISKLIAPVLLGALLLPLAAQAQNVNRRQDEQRERIQQGVRNGELTKREASHLRGQEARINRTEARDRRSGGLSFAERAQLQRRLNQNSRAIYNQKHDGQNRDRAPYINARRDEQRERIQSGVRNGSLTRREAEQLREREARIRQTEARDRRSGHRLTDAERRDLQRRQDNTSRDIYRQKHDGQNR